MDETAAKPVWTAVNIHRFKNWKQRWQNWGSEERRRTVSKIEEAVVYARKEQAKRDKLEKLRKKVEVEAKQALVAAITDEDIAEVVSIISRNSIKTNGEKEK